MTRDEQLLEVWKTTIEVQKHFNELEMRVRNVAVTILAAFLGAAGYSAKEGMRVSLWSAEVSLTALILLCGFFCWLAFYGMDRLWYHRLLRGAVNHGLTVENSLAAQLPEAGLTKAIGDASSFQIAGSNFGSDRKMDWFYRTFAGLLLIGALIAFIQPIRSVPATSARSERAALVAEKNASTELNSGASASDR